MSVFKVAQTIVTGTQCALMLMAVSYVNVAKDFPEMELIV